MKNRKILVVAMLDSIHTVRWLSQFQGEQIDFTIVASKKFKNLHPGLLELANSSSVASFKLANFGMTVKLAGYLDFFIFIFISQFLRINLRLIKLSSILRADKFDFIHALEIQGAGYLVDQAIRKSGVKTKFVLTNWGSDIYFYEKYPEQKKAIQSALQTATHYSAECNRDYILARELGFIGIEMPCIPNAGGFNLDLTQSQSLTSTRSNIVAKTYGGDFGRGDLVIESLDLVLNRFSEATAFLYSVTDDLIGKADKLKETYPGRVDYSDRRSSLSRDEMRNLFLKSRIYIGASRTDGISTSFLEALVSGCYPIQTNTSCADEWVNTGAKATLVDMDSTQISEAVSAAMKNNQLVDSAQSANKLIAKAHLSSQVIQPIAIKFYLS